MAPHTPLPASRCLFAAFTIASVDREVMSPRITFIISVGQADSGGQSFHGVIVAENRVGGEGVSTGRNPLLTFDEEEVSTVMAGLADIGKHRRLVRIELNRTLDLLEQARCRQNLTRSREGFE